MKKLLLIAALATMATTAIAAVPKAGDTAKADVEVRAEIIDEALTITDIYGGPIIIDFGQQQVKANEYHVGMTKKYKVNAATASSTALKLDATIKGNTNEKQQSPQIATVELKDFTNATNTAALKSNLTLRQPILDLDANKEEVYGDIDAKLTVPKNAIVGKYVGHAELKVTVKPEVKPGK